MEVGKFISILFDKPISFLNRFQLPCSGLNKPETTSFDGRVVHLPGVASSTSEDQILRNRPPQSFSEVASINNPLVESCTSFFPGTTRSQHHFCHVPKRRRGLSASLLKYGLSYKGSDEKATTVFSNTSALYQKGFLSQI